MAESDVVNPWEIVKRADEVGAGDGEPLSSRQFGILEIRHNRKMLSVVRLSDRKTLIAMTADDQSKMEQTADCLSAFGHRAAADFVRSLKARTV